MQFALCFVSGGVATLNHRLMAGHPSGMALAHHNRIGAKASAAYDFTADDQTHFSKAGAASAADLIVSELRRAVPGLAVWLCQACQGCSLD